jgi:thiol:disulfide interchange protein DsbD
VAVLVSLLRPDATGANTSQSEHVKAQLVADVQTIRPGSPFWLAIRFEIADEWHVNWINPGDAGLAPSVEWKMPAGFEASELLWPFPKRYGIGPLVIYGYDGELILMTRVVPPGDLTVGRDVRIAAGVDWLACAEACVPGSAEVEMTLPVRSQTPQARESWKAIFDKTRLDHPEPSGAWRVQAYLEDEDRITLEVRTNQQQDLDVGDCWFFPLEPGVIENGYVQEYIRRRSGFDLLLKRDRMTLEPPAQIAGVLVSKSGWDERHSRKAISIDVPLEAR